MDDLQTILINLKGYTAKKKKLAGRNYTVVNATILKEGVLNGSKGPLYYPADEVTANAEDWNNMPVVVYHPTQGGKPVSARTEQVLNDWAVGMLLNTVAKDGKLVPEVWFDDEATARVDNVLVQAPYNLPAELQIMPRLDKGEPVELSTGLKPQLWVKNEGGAVYNGQEYTYSVGKYKPDHLAVLPDQTGACSNADGCGIGVTNTSEVAGGGVGPSGNEETQGEPTTSVGSEENPRSWLQKLTDYFTSSGVANAKTKKEADGMHPASDYAYVPDPNKPSTWKLRIDDAAHVGGAVAALGKGFRGNKVEIPSSAMAKVKAKVRAAWTKFHGDKKMSEMPDVISNASLGLVENELGYKQISYMLEEALRGMYTQAEGYCWVVEVYDNYFVYEHEGEYYKLGYKKTTDGVTLTGQPVGVKREVTFTPVDNQKNDPEPKEERNIMPLTQEARKEAVDYIVANCDCWKSDEAKTLLNKSSDDQLLKFKEGVKPAGKVVKEEVVANTTSSTTAPAVPQPAAPANVQNRLTAEEQEQLAYAKRKLDEERSGLIERIVANTAEPDREAKRVVLRAKTLAQLEEIAGFLPPVINFNPFGSYNGIQPGVTVTTPRANYAGAGTLPAVNNAAGTGNDTLGTPDMDYSRPLANKKVAHA